MRRTGFTGGARVVGGLVAAMATSTVLLAQLPAEPGPTTVGTIGSGQPTFSAGVTLVTTDVIVRDDDGIFVPDLTREDFRIFEDEIEQEIVSMVLVHGGRVYNQLQPPQTVQEGIILPSSRPVDDTAGRIFVVFVDDLHLTPSLTPKIRQVFEVMADTLVHEGDLFGVISSGPSSLSIDMTYDRELLYAAGNRIMGDALSVWDQVNGMETSQGPSEILYRAHVAFKTARGVLRNLESVNDRRKVFLYLSEGYDFDPFPESRLYSGIFNQMREADRGSTNNEQFDDLYGFLPDPRSDPFETYGRQGQVFANLNLGFEVAELARAANRANTSFYTIDPRGLTAGPDLDVDIPLEEWNRHVFQTQGTLRMLSMLTGGMAIVNRNDFDDAFREIDAETSDYYVVGFYTSNPDPTVRTRRLRVDIRDRDDVDVRARTHYTLPRPPA
ncbi:MAG: VWA domain-containing protein [Acidobacteriota bacterium]|nr:VWA domain-containing protein [Acidobacteriota bacterium]